MAPSLCARTAFKLASLIETPGVFRSLRPRPSAAALGVVFAGRTLLRFSLVTAFPPNRARTRSAISSSSSSPLSFSRSASSRASRCEIRCFSCYINAVILVVSPWSVDHPPFAVLRYSPTNANEAYQKKDQSPKNCRLDEFLTRSRVCCRSRGSAALITQTVPNRHVRHFPADLRPHFSRSAAISVFHTSF